ncbi:type II toxin-antitoxin system HicA family toxin [Bombilactobacillus folatiphilus]|uniref:Type II toxin-antitoxin system HicA family toxin n=1 Tax=Bombilactobacillus folatiphilus TaxID=2923362 RepID=A0ABY4P787_9LACO|nr:type II toxin-antitoxin system HicA family toxin [Bombilactobacillus folatiphilus]UQS81568.1 type II toxin-antitoxin system HicA family toxin [Bombilactobacillus folatiphilus]
MPMKPREMVKLLKQNGFIEKSQQGSHLKMYNPITNVTVFVPIHSKELKKGMEQGILKEAGLK